MAKRRYTREALRLQPFMARVGESSSQIVVTETLGTMITLYHADGSPVETFAATDAGLDLASAAVDDAACQVVIPSNAVISSAHTLAGCSYVFPPGLVVTGTLGTADGTRVYHLNSVVLGDSAGPVMGVTNPDSGEAHLCGCDIAPVNIGAGGVYAVAVTLNAGDLYCHDCVLDATGAADGSDGYAGYRNPASAGNLFVIDGGTALGKVAADPFNE